MRLIKLEQFSKENTGSKACDLNSIEIGEGPLDNFHVDHLGPLASTKKNYNHILVWLYATKSTSTAEVVQHLKKQSTILEILDESFQTEERPSRRTIPRNTAEEKGLFMHVLPQLCRAEMVKLRGSIDLLTKLAAPKPGEWFKYLDLAKKYLNATQSTGQVNL